MRFRLCTIAIGAAMILAPHAMAESPEEKRYRVLRADGILYGDDPTLGPKLDAVWKQMTNMGPEAQRSWLDMVEPDLAAEKKKCDANSACAAKIAKKRAAGPAADVAPADPRIAKLAAMERPKVEQRWLRPLDAAEVGKGSSSGATFGMEHVVAHIDLPHPVKYYNQKWCQDNIPSDCDYPSGSVYMLLYVDGKPYKHHIAKLSDDAYSSAKKLAFVVLPKTDGEMFAPWGTKVDGRFRINQKGLLISTLIDQINGGKINKGKHTYTLKIIAGNKVPEDMHLTDADKKFYNEKGAFAFYAKHPAIAEVEGTFEVTAAGLKAFHKKTYLDVAKKKLRKNKKTEAELKKQLKGAKEVKILAVNQRFGWDIHYDRFRRPTHRTSSADVYYYNKKTKSHRYLYSRPIRADHKGNNKYGPARWTESMPNHMFMKSHDLIPGLNYPVSGKLKFR